LSDRQATGAATYVYCVGPAEAFSNGDAMAGVSGIGDHKPEIRMVQVDDLVAVVSDSPKVRYDVSRRNLLAHQRVLEQAMKLSTVLPVSFGTVASGDRDVEDALLRRERDEIKRLLAYVRGRVELGVTALWNRERLFAEIVSENREIRSLRDQLAGLGPDTAYYERIDLGQRTERAVIQKSERESRRILDALAPLAVETRVNETMSELMILNAAFLVDRAREAEFDAAVQALGEAELDRIVFRYVGPLPPHSFVHLAVQWER
jgi:hypothetical protein